MLLLLPALLLVVASSVSSSPTLLLRDAADAPGLSGGGVDDGDGDVNEAPQTETGRTVSTPSSATDVIDGRHQTTSGDAAVLTVTTAIAATARGGYAAALDPDGSGGGSGSSSRTVASDRSPATALPTAATIAAAAAGSQSTDRPLARESESETTVGGVIATDVAGSQPSNSTAAAVTEQGDGIGAASDLTDWLVTSTTAPDTENSSSAEEGAATPSLTSAASAETALWTTVNATASTAANNAEFHLVLMSSLVPVAGVFALLLFVAVICTAARKPRRRHRER